MIRADKLQKTFEDGHVAVQDATFHVRAGESLGLLGSNGSGKSTTLHMLLGNVEPTSGRAWLGGVCVQDEPLEAKKHVGYVSENVLLYGPLTARQNLRFFARLSGKKVSAEREEECLRRVGLDHAARRRVETFSKGMRQRLGIAVALVKDPAVLVLDEPTTGLDPAGVEELNRLVVELCDEGKALLVVTHDLFRLQDITDRIAVMRESVLSDAVPSKDVRDVEALYFGRDQPGRPGGARA